MQEMKRPRTVSTKWTIRYSERVFTEDNGVYYRCKMNKNKRTIYFRRESSEKKKN